MFSSRSSSLLHPLRRTLVRLLVACGVVVLAVALVPAAARADGDPASDVLVTQAVFVPWDAGVPARQAGELASLLQASAHAGVPVRVALIASPSDLGSVSALWQRPVAYARFLGQELSLVYHGRLLVVMPAGVGLSQDGRSLALTAGVIYGGLAARASTIVQRLAQADGHRLPAVTGPPAPAAHQVARATTPLGALVFVAGLMLVAIAWAVSLHVRPPGGRLGRLFTG